MTARSDDQSWGELSPLASDAPAREHAKPSELDSLASDAPAREHAEPSELASLASDAPARELAEPRGVRLAEPRGGLRLRWVRSASDSSSNMRQ